MDLDLASAYMYISIRGWRGCGSVRFSSSRRTEIRQRFGHGYITVDISDGVRGRQLRGGTWRHIVMEFRTHGVQVRAAGLAAIHKDKDKDKSRDRAPTLVSTVTTTTLT